MKRRGEAGFTMVELLITLSISVIGMTGALALHLATARANAGSAATADAIAAAQKTLEDARSQSYAELIASYGALPIDDDFGGTTITGRTETFTRRIQIDPVGGNNDLLRVRVEISWNDLGDHTIALELLRTRQEQL